jgi:hypothetical protein
MITLPFKIRCAQAVYGSFPFWERGYSVLAHSAGCRPEWLSELRTVCQRYGEPSFGVNEAGGLFALRLKSGPWMIAGAYPQGNDDHGRPGALAFHALFVNPWAYLAAGADPFVFAGALHCDWGSADMDRCLPTVFWTACDCPIRVVHAPDYDRQLSDIVTALTKGHRVIVHTNARIDGLAQGVWSRLPRAVRLRATVATWAFDNANRFDLVALPKLAGLTLEATDVVVGLEPAGSV